MVSINKPAHDRNGIPAAFGVTDCAPVPAPKPKHGPPARAFASRAHAAQRAAERLGLILSWDDLRAISLICKKGAGCNGKQPGSKEFHTVVYADRVLQVVYRRITPDEPNGIVLTVLPTSTIEHAVRKSRQHRAARLNRMALYKGRQS